MALIQDNSSGLLDFVAAFGSGKEKKKKRPDGSASANTPMDAANPSDVPFEPVSDLGSVSFNMDDLFKNMNA